MAPQVRFALALSARLLLAASTASVLPTPVWSDSTYPFLQGERLTDKKCNIALNRYLSCFYGDNMRRCVKRWGARACEEEKGAARGDYALMYSLNKVLDQTCPPDFLQMIERNIAVYRKEWGCVPRDKR